MVVRGRQMLRAGPRALKTLGSAVSEGICSTCPAVDSRRARTQEVSLFPSQSLSVGKAGPRVVRVADIGSMGSMTWAQGYKLEIRNLH